MNALVVRVVHVGVGQLIPAGAQGRGGGVLQQLQFRRFLLPHVVQTVLQHALDAMGCTQHAGDAVSLQSRLDSPLHTGIDDGGGAAGLSDDARAFQFAHMKSSYRNYSIFRFLPKCFR